ncbi:MAG: putative DNA binding domain-containing protein [Thaumarchaeota archaeon]|nr:putative DNA binding domain-containing protein [Nitrososphaerota archaeon]
MDEESFLSLLEDLKSLNGESEFSEFKENNSNMELMGDTISALSNGAALHERECAYLIFGVNDGGEITGTKFNPKKNHKGQDIKLWLGTQLDPEIHFEICSLEIAGRSVVVLIINPASGYPVKFRGKASIRVGSSTKPLNKHPGKEKALWQKLHSRHFEEDLAMQNLSMQDVLDKLDHAAFCKAKKIRVTTASKDLLIEKMQDNGLVKKSRGRFAITNLGAILWAKSLPEFVNLERKTPRLIIYKGKNRLNVAREIPSRKGYALGLPPLMEYILLILPANEEIEMVVRKEYTLYPPDAVRELIVNALIHQDLMATGTSTTIEIFEDRIEIKNPGKPLISTQRFIDAHPQSRNERLAKEMRLLGFCEERGSGIDKVVHLCEVYQLPAPLFSADEKSTTTVIFAPKEFSQMSKEDRTRAAYLHACLKFVNGEFMTNQSLRERFKITKTNYPQVSRIIQDAIGGGLIRFKDPESTSGRNAKYVPIWAR